MLNGGNDPFKNCFEVGDRVTVDGYPNTIFEVIEVNWNFVYKFGYVKEGYLYGLIDIKTGITYVSFDEDMKLISKFKDIIKSEDESKFNNTQIKWQEYEDNLTLFKLFGDYKYQDAAINIYCELIHNRDKF